MDQCTAMLCILPSSVLCVLNLICGRVVLQVTPMHTVLQQALIPATVGCDNLANILRTYPCQAGYKTPSGKVGASTELMQTILSFLTFKLYQRDAAVFTVHNVIASLW